MVTETAVEQAVKFVFSAQLYATLFSLFMTPFIVGSYRRLTTACYAIRCHFFFSWRDSVDFSVRPTCSFFVLLAVYSCLSTDAFLQGMNPEEAFKQSSESITGPITKGISKGGILKVYEGLDKAGQDEFKVRKRPKLPGERGWRGQPAS